MNYDYGLEQLKAFFSRWGSDQYDVFRQLELRLQAALQEDRLSPASIARQRTVAQLVQALDNLTRGLLRTSFGDLCDPKSGAHVDKSGNLEVQRSWKHEVLSEMVLVPSGNVTIGHNMRSADEAPQHVVSIPAFYISRYPVTNGEFARFLKATGHPDKSKQYGRAIYRVGETRPVVDVSWFDATVYCEWLSRTIGYQFRLPTEFEWEKACRGGMDLSFGPNPHPQSLYPWGDFFDRQRCNTEESGPNKPTEVGRFSPADNSVYGISDMVGNVWEWTDSLFEPYPVSPDHLSGICAKPVIAELLGRKQYETAFSQRVVMRGGSFGMSQKFATATYRLWSDASDWAEYGGFRLAASAHSIGLSGGRAITMMESEVAP